MSNDLVLKEARMNQVTCIVRERELRLHGLVARLLAEDPAHQIRFLSKYEGLDYAECASTGFTIASG